MHRRFEEAQRMTTLQGWIVIGLLVLIVLGIIGIGAELEALPYVWRTHDVGSLNPSDPD
jgi:hypothetical protein